MTPLGNVSTGSPTQGAVLEQYSTILHSSLVYVTYCPPSETQQEANSLNDTLVPPEFTKYMYGSQVTALND